MARSSKKGGGEPPAETTEAAPRVGASVLINQRQLKALLNATKSIANQTSELVGSLREKIAYAVEKQGLHKKAFAEVRKLDKMEPEQALEYETHRAAYMDMLGITEKINAAARLPMGDEKATGTASDDDVGGAPSNVARLPRRRSAAAEETATEDERETEAVH